MERSSVWNASVAVLLVAVMPLGAQVPVPTTGCYHSAFTPNEPSMGAYGHDDFEALAGRSVAIEMFYTGWPGNRLPDFPKAKCDDIVSRNAYPHITWEPWMTGSPYPLDGIITHGYDAYITGYALQVKDWGRPLFIRLGHEMNGNWYPWCGSNNGGSATTGFGDPAKADGPERFISAFRRVRFLFDSVGVTNASWVWCVNNFPVPYEDWNRPLEYYPGDDVVDWIGLDGYNWGTSQSWSGWTSFRDTFNEVYTTFSGTTKPMMIAEFASAEVGGNKAQWILDAYMYTRLLYTRIKAITWFNINKETDWRVNSSTAAVNAYASAVSDPYFLGAVTATSVTGTDAPPTSPSLAAPYPNPFNGTVRIVTTLPAADEGVLRIVNILGQEVAVIGSGPFPSGERVMTWNGRDAGGRDVPSGVYFAHLVTKTINGVQRILLTR